MDPVRLDRLLVDRGLVPSRPRAERLITDHGVRVDGIEVRKPGKKVSPNATLDLLGEDLPWVSRGALKLVAALDHYTLDPSGRVVLDLGASTGGFTEVCLHHGARFVHAVDVGDHLDAGIASLRCHEIYLAALDGHQDPDTMLRSSARATGAEFGCEYATAFEIVGGS